MTSDNIIIENLSAGYVIAPSLQALVDCKSSFSYMDMCYMNKSKHPEDAKTPALSKGRVIYYKDRREPVRKSWA